MLLCLIKKLAETGRRRHRAGLFFYIKMKADSSLCNYFSKLLNNCSSERPRLRPGRARSVQRQTEERTAPNACKMPRSTAVDTCRPRRSPNRFGS